mgnify:CR=1 FL=1
MDTLILNQPKEVKRVNLSINIIDFFLNSQDMRQSSKETYKRAMRQFFTWIKNTDRNLNELTIRDLIVYKTDLLEKLSPLTVGSYLTVLRTFYSWAEANKIYPNITKGLKTPRRENKFQKQHLINEYSKNLLSYFEKTNLRNFAMINLMIRTGLRTIEVARANIEDLSFKGGKRILYVQSKGKDGRTDFVILTPKAYEPIKEYLNTREGSKGSDPLFVSNSYNNLAGRLTTRSIRGITKKGLKAIGLNEKEYTAHSLRHTTAVNILKSGGAITDAQAVLRHSTPVTTEIYIKSIEEELRIQNAPEELIDNLF